MQAPRRTSRTNGVDFRRLVKQGSNEIAEHWLKAVRADSVRPATESSAEPLLLHAVPLVLHEILRVIQLDDDEVEREKICSAARHGRESAREHVDVSELVRECQVLREKVFHYLDKQFARDDRPDTASIYRRVGLALDMAMRETIKAFVEEHLLQLRHLSCTDSLTGLFNHRTFLITALFMNVSVRNSSVRAVTRSRSRLCWRTSIISNRLMIRRAISLAIVS